MTIDEKIRNIDTQLAQINIRVNSNYSTPLTLEEEWTELNYLTTLVNKISNLRDQRKLLLKQKERQDKINKINESLL